MEEFIMLGIGAAISADYITFFESLKSVAFIAITSVICVLGSKTISFLNEKIKRQMEDAINDSKLAEIDAAHSAMLDAIDIIHDTVETLNETMKKEIIKASSDGKLSKEDGAKLFNTAMATIKSCLNENLINDIKYVVGDIDAWITNQIEIWVAQTKETK